MGNLAGGSEPTPSGDGLYSGRRHSDKIWTGHDLRYSGTLTPVVQHRFFRIARAPITRGGARRLRRAGGAAGTACSTND
jgi:hypothetical protein